MKYIKDIKIELRVVVIICQLLLIGRSFAQQQDKDSVPLNWHLLDRLQTGYYGIGIERAYRELLKGKTADTVLVAIIDTGIDTIHEDLRAKLWKNPLDSGMDEDHNGYQGDKYGWNYLGNKAGSRLTAAGIERDRIYYAYRDTYGDKESNEIPRSQRKSYQNWQVAASGFIADSLNLVNSFWNRYRQMEAGDKRLRQALGKSIYTYTDMIELEDYISIAGGLLLFEFEKRSDSAGMTNQTLLELLRTRIPIQTENYLNHFKEQYQEGIRQRLKIIGDNLNDLNDSGYGNGDVMDTSGHGTHVAGIIGADRNNSIGIKGIADAIKIIVIRAVPSKGDEYDKDIALAIRYAVDQGAKVINISFGKYYSPHQKWIEDSIGYASKNDVLLVNGAGNNGKDIDIAPMYPRSKYLKKNKRFPNMITVGASGPTKEHLIGTFSNYGKNMVDVFAPGVDIYSTWPGHQYRSHSGTSMASPVVAGVAAVLRSYFPFLSAEQVKNIIEDSVTRIDWPVTQPGQWNVDDPDIVRLSMEELCKTGGIINSYNAVLTAQSLSVPNHSTTIRSN